MVHHKKEDTKKMPISELRRYKLKMHILRLLYKRNSQSASNLSKKINVSLPTVRAILEDLITENVVCTSGTGDSQGGRKPTIYSLSENAFHIMAVEIGHHSAKVVIFNSHNKEKTKIHELATNIDDPKLEEKLELVFYELLKEAQLQKENIRAIGICMPGLIDAQKGINRTIKNPTNQAIGQRLTKRFNISTYIENDARMQALGEFVFGKAKKTNNTLVLNWNWGLGLGVILNGEIYTGSTGFAGEYSHIRVVENGNLCECGKRGCLQTIAGAQNLLDLAKEKIVEGTISQLTTKFAKNTNNLTITDIINSAKKGDELSIYLLTTISTKLAWGLSILVQLFNPELIVLNGPFIKANQFVLLPIQQALNQYCLDSILNNVKVELSELGEFSGLKGVAVMVFQKIFRDKSAEH